ncbi:hypothetical protein SADUNF_Sadunf03G0167800 [Salix dunnii]|uniref:WRKY domain-containing protein n=1 Tax=Salix dunnii TaxID=1413687 RepID=A0A835N586_9ROSI|nr:hypothetical protein SADUNF_Sadunf03G0167800 [Salix dunnii]
MVSSALKTREEDREEQDTDRGGQRLVLPEDGYEWKKYGQKSYFKCQTENCVAKKRVEWSSPDNLRILYEGSHNHVSSTTRRTNQFNLYTQVFGDDQPAASRTHDQDA